MIETIVTENAFEPFPKLARLSRDCVITEKIDGTNAQIFITPDLALFAGSRNRWLTLEQDNYGFASWVYDHASELLRLGPGRHFGEWWGRGIQRNYGMDERRFSLFNVRRWANPETTERPPSCVSVVPVLYTGTFDTNEVKQTLWDLSNYGSKAAPGFGKPEGIVVFHTAASVMFKKTIEKDEKPKGQR